MALPSRVALDTSAAAVVTSDLYLIRCLRPAGIRTVAVTWGKDDPFLFSRHCREQKIVADNRTDPDQYVRDLIELGKTFTKKPMLCYNSDTILLTVSRYREQLAPYYHFLLPPAEHVEAMVDKLLFAGLAEKYGMPVPVTVRSEELTSADDALARVTLPCILKPDSRHYGWNTSELAADRSGTQKVVIAETPDEFRRMFDAVRELSPRFVVQPYIPGGDDHILSFHGYFNAKGEPLGYFVGKKIRTFPKNNGVSTYLELTHSQEVVDLSLAVLRRMNFVGAIKIDFKKDPVTGKLWILEFNPRFTLWNQLGAAAGLNLPLLAYAEQTGQPCTPQFDYTVGTRWLAFGPDLRAFLRSYRPAGEWTWPQYVRSMLYPKVYDQFAWDDPGPFLATFRGWLKLVVGKLTGRKQKHAEA